MLNVNVLMLSDAFVSVFMLSVVILSVIVILSVGILDVVIKFNYTKCECSNAE
jgi:hypothetical protein